MWVRRIKWFFLVVTLIFLGASAYYLSWTWNSSIERISNNAFLKAETTAISLQGEMLKNLRGLESDKGSFSYKSVKNRLNNIRELDENVRFIYFYKQKNEELVFLVDSEPENSPDYISPGEIYIEADEQYWLPFETGESAIIGPVSDRWGSWRSVLVPVKDDTTGEILSVLGMDYPVGDWEEQARFDVIKATVVVFISAFLLYLFYYASVSNLRLVDSEGTLRQITENMSEVFWLRSADNKQMLYISPSYEKVWGRTTQSLYANPDSFLESVYEEDLQRVLEEFQKEKDQGGVFDVEYRIVRPDKKIRWVWARSFPVRDKRGKIIKYTGMGVDITERKKVERHLIESEARYEQLAQQSKSFTWEIDRKGLYTYLSEGSTKLLGYKPDDIVGKKYFFELAPKEDKEEIKEIGISMMEKNKSVQGIENKITTKSGEILWVLTSGVPIQDHAGKVVGYRGIDIDITERKKAEESLRRFKQASESAMPAIYITDKEGNVEYANDSFEKITGHKIKDIMGKNPRFLKSGKMPKEYYKKLWQTLSKGKSWSEEVINRRKNGELYFAFQTISPILDDSGKVEAFVAIQNDISDRKETEKALSESETKYKALVENANDIIYSLTPEGVFTYVSPNWKQALGHDPSKVLGKPFTNFVNEEDVPVCFEFLKKVVKSKKAQAGVEYRIKHKSGDWRWHTSNTSPLFNSKGEVKSFIGVARDITNKKTSDEEIENNLKQQKVLAEISLDLNKYEDFDATLEKVLKKIGENSKVCRAYIFEENSQEATISNTYEWVAKDVKAEIKNLQNISKSSLRYIFDAFEKKGILKSSNVSKLPRAFSKHFTSQGILSVLLVPLKIQGEMFGFIGLDETKEHRIWVESDVNLLVTISSAISNIYERRLNTGLINKEKDKLETILEGIGDGVFVLDAKKRLILFNAMATEISGFSLKDVLGKDYKEVLNFVHEKDGSVNDSFVNDAFATGQVQEMTNHTLLYKKDGTTVPVSDSAAPLKNEDGGIIGCVVVFRDVTKEKAIDKMKTEFISVASHQLKTPLAGIKWMCELLLGGKVDKVTKEQETYLKDIYFSNERMLKLVDDLLNVSHIETGRKFTIEKKSVDVVKIVGEVLKENEPLANERGVSVVTCPNAPKVLKMHLDGSKIKQVFANLINNAIKYSKQGGEVKISCKENKKEKVFSIKDSGIGISKLEQKQIFEKFFRAENALVQDTDGTGLGLYIAKAIVQAHGGKIWFESKKNQGTTFFFSLPVKGK